MKKENCQKCLIKIEKTIMEWEIADIICGFVAGLGFMGLIVYLVFINL